MVDNTRLNKNTTQGDVYASDDIGGVKHTRVKVEYGDDGSATDVSFNKPFPVDFVEPRTDAFGRLRVANPLTLFDIQHQYNTQPLFWNDTLVFNGTISHLPDESSVSLNLTTVNGDRVTRETKRVFRYQPGKSQLVTLTGVLGAKKPFVEQRLGLFDDSDGLFFEQDSLNTKVVVRSSTSGSPVDNPINQSAWNLDKLDGTGPSGLTLDPAMAQIFCFDMQWLGVGRVRFGFVIDGHMIYCHEFNHANLLANVYMKTANLPIRYDIHNVGTPASSTSMKQICCSIVSEGGFEKDGIPFTIANGATAISVTTRRPILSIRPKATFNSIINNGIMLPRHFHIISSTQNLYYEIVQGGSLTNDSFSSVDGNSIMEFDVAGSAITGGRVIDSGYIAATSQAGGSAGVDTGILSKVPLGSTEPLTIVATSLSSSTDTFGSFTWSEIY